MLPIGAAPKAPKSWKRPLTAKLIFLFVSAAIIPGLALAPQALGAGGQYGTQKREIDLNFIHVGSTSRDEILKKLSWADGGIKSDEMFLARWGNASRSSQPSVKANGKRIPYGNLMVEFDPRGIVQSSRLIREKSLAQELSDWVVRTHQPPLDLSVLIEISVFDVVQRAPFWSPEGPTVEIANLILGRDSIQLLEPRDGFQIPPREISKIASHAYYYSLDPAFPAVTVHFARNSKAGKTRFFEMHPPDLVTLIRYFLQTRPAIR